MMNERNELPLPISEDMLQAWVDDALSPAQRAQVDAYLNTHPQATQRLNSYRHQRMLLRQSLAAIAEEPVPPALNIHRMVQRMANIESGARRSRQRFSHWQNWRSWLLPGDTPPRWTRASACLLLGLGGLLGGMLGGIGGWALHSATQDSHTLTASTPMMRLGMEAAASYKTYAPDPTHPVEIRASERSLLARWVYERTGQPLMIPELDNAGYRFMGGRVLASTHGATVLLMYDNDQGSRLILLARPMQNTQSQPMQALSVDEVRGFVWIDNGLGYSLVGAMAAQVLHPLADELRRQLQRGQPQNHSQAGRIRASIAPST